MAEGNGERDDLECGAEMLDRLVIRRKPEGNYAAEAVFHLFFGDFMTRIARETGIGDERDVLPLFQPFGNLLR